MLASDNASMARMRSFRIAALVSIALAGTFALSACSSSEVPELPTMDDPSDEQSVVPNADEVDESQLSSEELVELVDVRSIDANTFRINANEAGVSWDGHEGGMPDYNTVVASEDDFLLALYAPAECTDDVLLPVAVSAVEREVYDVVFSFDVAECEGEQSAHYFRVDFGTHPDGGRITASPNTAVSFQDAPEDFTVMRN